MYNRRPQTSWADTVQVNILPAWGAEKTKEPHTKDYKQSSQRTPAGIRALGQWIRNLFSGHVGPTLSPRERDKKRAS